MRPNQASITAYRRGISEAHRRAENARLELLSILHELPSMSLNETRLDLVIGDLETALKLVKEARKTTQQVSEIK